VGETERERERGGRWHRLRWPEKTVLNEICGRHREDETDGWRRQHDVLCFPVNNGREIG
jgi:hypothetical protein